MESKWKPNNFGKGDAHRISPVVQDTGICTSYPTRFGIMLRSHKSAHTAFSRSLQDTAGIEEESYRFLSQSTTVQYSTGIESKNHTVCYWVLFQKTIEIVLLLLIVCTVHNLIQQRWKSLRGDKTRQEVGSKRRRRKRKNSK